MESWGVFSFPGALKLRDACLRLINHPGDRLADSRWSLGDAMRGIRRDSVGSTRRLRRGDFGDANTSFECDRGAMVVPSKQVVVDRIGFA
jgi:hypothetical protein